MTGVIAVLDTDGFDLESLRQEDHYHFSIPFEYIEKNYGNDNYDIATAYMEVDVDWDESIGGYGANYYCPEEGLIDQSQGNSDIDGFFESDVYFVLKDELEEEGVSSGAMAF